MQNRELGSGFGVVDIRFLSSMPSAKEYEKFNPNEYLVIKVKNQFTLIYIDDENNKNEIAVDNIHGLKQALASLPDVPFETLTPEHKMAVQRPIQAHQLKTRGGNEFTLFEDEVYKGLINGFPKEKIPLVNQWIKSDITAILDNRTLALIIPDILVDMEATRLRKKLPKIVAGLPNEIKILFSNINILRKLDKRFLISLKKSLPDAMPQTLDANALAEFLSIENIGKIHPEILAYLIPAVLDLLEDKELEEASVAIAKKLKPKDFRAIADEQYFHLAMQTTQDKLTLKNNQRTIAFFAEDSKSELQHRGQKWQLDHSHFHLEAKGGEREYKIYRSRKELETVLKGSLDPNLKIVGELHTVYKRTSKRGNLKYTAIAFLLKIGADNLEFEKILDQVATLDTLTINHKIDLLINYQQTFMPTLEKAQKTNSLFFHSWASIKSKTPGFNSGLRFNIVPEAIEISQRQYDRFAQLFGELAVLPDEKVLEPIDRKANHRQPRYFQ